MDSKQMFYKVYEKRHLFRGLKSYLSLGLSSGIQSSSQLGSLAIRDVSGWRRRFRNMLLALPDLGEVAQSFFSDRMDLLQFAPNAREGVICIIVERNDLIRLKANIQHHREIGVGRFVVVDNDSNEETLEWLRQQNDVDVVHVCVPYSTNRREAWVNRVISYYGVNRWYLVVDSDEMLDIGFENHATLDSLVKELEGAGRTRARALMVDMYARPEYYVEGTRGQFLSECVYFDFDTYSKIQFREFDAVYGGPRERVFGQSALLTKYPLFYPGNRGVECKSHFLFPLRENVDSECHLYLRHYKFLPGDAVEYKRRALNGGYYNSSSQYKRYLDVLSTNDNQLNFYHDQSARYFDPSSFNIIKGI